MIADFTFALASASYHIRDNGHDWLARCSANFIDTSRDSFPLRGDVTFLNSIPAEITIAVRKDGALNQTMMAAGLDEQVAAWRKDGYSSVADAYVLRYWPKQNDSPEFLAMTVALDKAKFDRFHEFMARHVGRGDLFARFIAQFHGFSEPHSEMPSLPTRQEFVAGRHYFVVCGMSIAFGSSLP